MKRSGSVLLNVQDTADDKFLLTSINIQSRQEDDDRFLLHKCHYLSNQVRLP